VSRIHSPPALRHVTADKVSRPPPANGIDIDACATGGPHFRNVPSIAWDDGICCEIVVRLRRPPAVRATSVTITNAT